METQIWVDLLVSHVGTGFLGAGFFNWIFRTWISERIKNAIKSEYDQKLETHKAELQSQSDVAIEKLKSQLALVGVEHQVRFSKLHEMRFIAITEVYEKLMRVRLKLDFFSEWLNEHYESIGAEKSDKEKRNLLEKWDKEAKSCSAAEMEFINFFPSKEIFFPDSLTEKLLMFNQEFSKLCKELLFVIEKKDTLELEEALKSVMGKIVSQKKIVDEVAREIKSECQRLIDPEAN